MMLDNVIFLSVFGIIHGILSICAAWILANNIFNRFVKNINIKPRKETVLARGILPIVWITSFGFFWILSIYLGTLLPIKDDLWIFFSRFSLICMFLTLCIFNRYS